MISVLSFRETKNDLDRRIKMAQRYRIIFQTYDDNAPNAILTQEALLEDGP